MKAGLFLAVLAAGAARAADPLVELRTLVAEERAQAAEAAALALIKTLPHPADAGAADALDSIGEALTLSGHPAALETLERAAAARGGNTSTALAETHYRIGAEHELRRDYGRALDSYGFALDLAEKFKETGAGTRVKSLAGRGRALIGLARYDEAGKALTMAAALAPGDVAVRLGLAQIAYLRNDLALAEKIVAETEATGGAGSLEHARILLARAGLALERGRYREAEAGLRTGLAQLEQRLGPSNRQLVPPLRNLARCLRFAGEHAASIEIAARAVAISEAGHGAESATTAQLLGTLATAKAESGYFSEAQRLYHRLLEIETKVLGAEHPQVAADLFSLANLEQVLGDFAGSIAHARRSLAIREAAEGRETARTGPLYSMLGRVHAMNGELARGLELATLAVEIGRRTAGAGHPRTVFALSDLGEVLILSGQPEKARTVLTDSLAGMEKLFGRDSVRTAQAAYNLGLAERAAGRHDEALQWFQRAERSWRKSFGAQYPLLAEALAGVGASLVGLGRPGEALEPALESASIRRRAQTSVALTASEREALIYATVDRDGLTLALDLAAGGRLAEAEVRLVWDALIRDRASVLDTMARRMRLARSGAGVPALLDEVARLKKELAQTALLGDPKQYAARTAELRETLAAAERRLAELSPGLDARDVGETVGWDGVARALPADAALVAYARTPRNYVAFVLGPQGGGPWAVGLGPASRIDALAAAWRRQLEVERQSRGRNARRNEASLRAAGAALRRAIWDPVASRVAGAAGVRIVPDGAIQMVNLDALPQGSNRYLLEAAAPFAVLTAERDLAQSPKRFRRRGRLVALGDPALDAEAAAAVARCGPAPEFSLGRLPAAAREAGSAAAQWKAAGGEAAVMTGPQASESAVKAAAPGARVLHVAAHGYYLAPECRLPNEAALAASPLLRSGLVLAGGPRAGAEDGLLTAEEISGMNLDALELSVLSGCETAMGQHQDGEGMLGLRRAFRAAGAGWLVSSLWPVEDAAARDWMREFYRGLLNAALPPERAARAASLAQLRRRRAAGLSTHPFHWAAFQAAQ